MPPHSFLLQTPRLILVPTPLAIKSPSYLTLYANVHADAVFCMMGFGPAYPPENWTQDQTRERIIKRDITRSWETRQLGDFAVCLRSSAEMPDLPSRALIAATQEEKEDIYVIEGIDESIIEQSLKNAEWIGYAGVREATTTSMPPRTESDAPLPPWQEMVELRYGVAPQHWGKGMAREAAEAVMQWAGRERGVMRFIAETEAANGRSARVLEKTGFSRREGTEYWKGEEELEWERVFVA